MAGPTTTLDEDEVRRFGSIAAEWWDPNGKFRPLHQLGPARLGFVRESAITHFGRDRRALRPLDGLTVLDIGCGGGLVSEPLAAVRDALRTYVLRVLAQDGDAAGADAEALLAPLTAWETATRSGGKGAASSEPGVPLALGSEA